MFLIETYLDEYPADCLHRRAKMDRKMVVRSDGRKGRLLMMSKKVLMMLVQSSQLKLNR